MYQKTIEKEEGYSKAEIDRIKVLFHVLEKARNSKGINAYTDRVLAKLKG